MIRSLSILIFFAASLLGFNNELRAQCTGTLITSFTVTDVTNASCFNGSDGSIEVTLVGGQAPFTYSLVVETGFGDIPIETVSNTSLQVVTFSNLFAGDLAGGTYRVNVVTSNGGTPILFCTRRQVSGINLTQPTDITFSTGSITPSCNGNDGAILVTASGGTPGYSYAWSGPTAIGNTANPTGLAPGSYDVTVTDGNGCQKSIAGIAVPSGPTVDAGPAQNICAGSTVSLSGIVGGAATGGIWSGGAGTFSSNTNLNATYTPAGTDLTNGTVTLTLTTTGGSCTAVNDQVTITISPVPTVEAGLAQSVCGGSPATLGGSSVGGAATTGAWSIVNSPVGGNGVLSSTAQTAAPQTVTFSATVAGAYTLRLTTNDPAGPCLPATDDVIITIEQAATVDAGPAQTICAGSTVTLAGVFGGSATSATWSGGGGSFAPNNTTLNAVYTPSAAQVTAGTVNLTLTTDDPAGSCPSVNDNVTITINALATVDAGPAQTICAGSTVTLAGVFGGSATSATWSGGTGSFAPNNTTMNAVYTPSAAEVTAGTVTLTLTTNDPLGPCGAVNDNVTITIGADATADAGPAQIICSDVTVSLAGSIGGSASIGTWSGGAGTFAPNNTTLNAVYTPSAAEISASTVTLTLTTDDPAGACLPASDNVIITINQSATADAGVAQTICADGTATLAGAIGGSATSATWSGGTGTFAPDNTTLNAVYTPSAAEIAAGTVTLTLTTDDPAGTCLPAVDNIVITINPVATVDAGLAQTICADGTITLAGVIGGSATSATWSGGTGTFAPNNTTLNAVYTPSAAEVTAGTVSLTLTTDDPAGSCGPVNDNVVFTINPIATVDAGPAQAICAGSTLTLAGVTGGSAASATWSGGTGTFAPNNTTLNAVYTPSAAEVTAGTVTLTLTTDDPAGACGPVNDNVIFTINPIATVDAGPTQTICASSTITLAGVIGGSATSALWSGGTGTFNPNASALNAIYTPSAAEITAGILTLTLTTDDPAGSCNAVTDNVTINIAGVPTASLSGDATVCQGESTNLTISLTGGGPWDVVYTDGSSNFTLIGIVSSPASITVSPSISTSYSLVSVTNTGCGAGTVAGTADVVIQPIGGNPVTFGAETWIGYVYNDASSPAPPVSNINFNLSKYRGFISAADIDAATVASSYDVTTDEFDLNLGNLPMQGPNVCGSYANNFSIRFRMAKTFAAGLYTFRLGSDDGVRMFIDGAPVSFSPANSFTVHSYLTYTSNIIALSAGSHDIVIEYFERTGQARVSFAYDAAAGPTLSTTGDVCINSAAPTLTASSTDPSVIGFNWYTDATLTTLLASTANYTPVSPGELDLTVAGATTFFATAEYAGGLETNASSITVNVLASAVITATDQTVCESSGVLDLSNFVSAVPAGGAFTFSGTGITTSPTFDPTGLAGTTIPVAVTYTSGTCTQNSTLNVTVTNNAVINLPASNPQICQTGGLVDLNTFVSALPAGGNFVFTGTDVNSATDQLDPALLTGAQSISVDYTIGACVATTVTLTVDVISTPVITLVSPIPSICEGSAAVDLTTYVASLSPAGGTLAFTGNANIFGNQFDPTGLTAGPQSMQVEYTAVGCGGTVTTPLTIDIISGPSLTTDNSTIVCQGASAIDLTTLVTPSPSGGTFTFVGTGVTGNLFTPGTLSGTQLINVAYTQGGCTRSSTVTIVVNSGPDASRSATAFPSLICAGASSAVVVASQNNIVYQLRLDTDNSNVGGSFLGNGFSLSLPTPDLSAQTIFNVLATNIDGSCPVELTQTVTITTRATTDPLCGSGSGGGPGTGTCAAVVIIPEPLPATCTNSDGSIIFHIKPFVPVINNTGVKVSITGVSPTNQTIARTIFNDTIFSALPIGTYDYEIEYGDVACLKTGQVTIDRSGTIGVPVVSNITSPICAGDPTASFTLDVPGETGNVLQWSVDGTNFTNFNAGSRISGFVAGDYVISVRRTSADVCNAAVTLNITDGFVQPVSLVSAIKQDATCNSNDGSISVSLTGGAAPYVYKFGPAGSELDITGLPINNTFTGLVPGNYNIIVTDASGCAPKTLALPVVGFPGIVSTNTIVTTDPTCAGNGENGSISFNIENNFAGQFQVAVLTSFSTIPVETDFVAASPNPVFIPNLSAGDYFVWVKSINALCPTRIDPSLTRLRGAVRVNFTATTVDEKCFGEGGSIQLSNIGGIQEVDYQYVLNTGSQTLSGTISATAALLNPEIAGLAPGVYDLILRQSGSVLSCESNVASGLVIDGPNTALVIADPTVPSPQQETSFEDDPTATRVLVVTGGSPVYFMELQNSFDEVVRPRAEVLLVNTSYSLQYSGLGPGTYTALVEDEFGCVAEKEFVVGLKTDIFIPNVFTPDNDVDQKNEVFFIRNLVTGSKLVITNRWGNEVYASNDYQNNWNAEGVSDGIYYYSLQSGGQEYTGWVEILRGNKP